jgi:molecular chaperone DnaK (HSP70)
MSLHRVVGIDLGTTYSAVATYDSDELKTIMLDNYETNEQTTPSVVSINPIDRRVMVGRAAKNNLPNDPLNTIVEIKREMGATFIPETLDKFGWRETYRPGDPVRVRFRGEIFLPQEISAFTLMKMKEIAEKRIGEEIRDAVITVPAYFKENQRAATEEAALLAGLYPRQLLPEPTAAAICYGVDTAEAAHRTYLVYDLGGGTFDVSIITVEDQKINVIATAGDPRLGGGDFDDAITIWAIEELKKRYQFDIGSDQRARAFIKLRSEMTKIQLSSHPDGTLPLGELRPHNPPTLVLTRPTFEGLIENYLKKSLACVEKSLEYAGEKGVKREQIDAILLVGGSSKIPRVRTKLLEHFRKDESFIRTDLDPDAVVARGAAVLASRIQPNPPPFEVARHNRAAPLVSGDGQDIDINMITEHSLGVGVQDNFFHKIVERGTNIPVSKREPNFTNPDNATAVMVPVYQGEGRYVMDNTLIGTLPIQPIEPRPSGYHKFEVTFSIDRNGLLSMVVHHMNTGIDYPAKFEQKTAVGGDAALATRGIVLRTMFTPPAATVIVPPPTTWTTPAVPAPGAYFPAGSVAAQGGYAAPSAVPTTVGVPGGVAIPGAPPSVSGAAAPVAGPGAGTIPAAQPAPAAPVLPARDVPDQFKSIVRRAQKQLLIKVDLKVLTAFNAFTNALNLGCSEKDLEDLGDDLADAYERSTATK